MTMAYGRSWRGLDGPLEISCWGISVMNNSRLAQGLQGLSRFVKHNRLHVLTAVCLSSVDPTRYPSFRKKPSRLPVALEMAQRADVLPGERLSLRA